MRKIERVLVSTFNTITEGKRLVIISEDRLSELLTEDMYFVYLGDLGGGVQPLDYFTTIDNTKVLGHLNNFKIVGDSTTGIINLYADFTITYRGSRELSTEFYMMTVVEQGLNDEYINGDNIKLIRGWYLK